MSRSGYCDDLDNWALIRWRGAVNSAIKGKKGQAFLREILDAMEKTEVKELTHNGFQADGKFCTLGLVGENRKLDMESIDSEDSEMVADAFRISKALAKEIMFENDEGGYYKETDFNRFKRMQLWVQQNIAK